MSKFAPVTFEKIYPLVMYQDFFNSPVKARYSIFDYNLGTTSFLDSYIKYKTESPFDFDTSKLAERCIFYNDDEDIISTGESPVTSLTSFIDSVFPFRKKSLSYEDDFLSNNFMFFRNYHGFFIFCPSHLSKKYIYWNPNPSATAVQKNRRIYVGGYVVPTGNDKEYTLHMYNSASFFEFTKDIDVFSEDPNKNPFYGYKLNHDWGNDYLPSLFTPPVTYENFNSYNEFYSFLAPYVFYRGDSYNFSISSFEFDFTGQILPLSDFFKESRDFNFNETSKTITNINPVDLIKFDEQLVGIISSENYNRSTEYQGSTSFSTSDTVEWITTWTTSWTEGAHDYTNEEGETVHDPGIDYTDEEMSMTSKTTTWSTSRSTTKEMSTQGVHKIAKSCFLKKPLFYSFNFNYQIDYIVDNGYTLNEYTPKITKSFFPWYCDNYIPISHDSYKEHLAMQDSLHSSPLSLDFRANDSDIVTFELPKTYLLPYVFRIADSTSVSLSNLFENKSSNYNSKNFKNYSLLNAPIVAKLSNSDMFDINDYPSAAGLTLNLNNKVSIIESVGNIISSQDNIRLVFKDFQGLSSEVTPSPKNSYGSKFIPLTQEGVDFAMANAESLVRSYSKFKTNMLCLTSDDIENGDYEKVIAALNHMFALSKNEGMFLLFNYNLYFGKTNDSMYVDNSSLYNSFLKILKGGVIESGDSLTLISSSFNFTYQNIINALKSEVLRSFNNECYLSNAVNIFTYSDNYFNSFTSEQLSSVDYSGFFINTINKFNFGDTFIFLNSSRKNEISLKYQKSFSSFSSVEPEVNSLQNYEIKPVLIFDEKISSRCFWKKGQKNVDFIKPKGLDGETILLLDLNNLLPSASTQLLQFPNDSPGEFINSNFFLDFSFNGVSNNLVFQYTDEGYNIVNLDNSSPAFDFEFSLDSGNKLKISYKSSHTKEFLVDKLNKISFALYHSYEGAYTKVYYEEAYINYITADIKTSSSSAFLNEDLNVNFNITTGLASYVPSNIPAGKPSWEKYSLVYKTDDKTVGSTVISGSEYPVFDIDFTINNVFSKKKNLKEILNVINESFPKNYNLYSDYHIVLRRYTDGCYKDIFYTSGVKYPKPTKDNFELVVLKSNKTVGNISEGLRGYAILATKNIPSIDYFYSSLFNVEMLINVSAVSRPFEYSKLSLLTASLGSVYTDGKALIYQVYYNATGDIPDTLDYLDFNNDGETIFGRLNSTLIFKGAEDVLDLEPSENLIGVKATVESAQYDIFSRNNAKKLLDVLNPETFIFYNQNINFDLSYTDPTAEKYNIYQLSNDIENYRSMSSGGDYNYYIESERIVDFRNYPGTLNYQRNTEDVKIRFKRSVLTSSGSLQDRISADLNIPVIIRKRPSIPVLNDNTTIFSKITVNNENKIATSDLSQYIEFDSYNDIYSDGLINSIEGYLFDPVRNTNLSFEYECELKSDLGSFIPVIFESYFRFEDNVQESIKNNSKITFDFSSLPLTKIKNKNTGDYIDYSLINSLKRNGKTYSTIDNNLYVNDFMEDYVSENQDSLNAGTLSINVKVRSCDITFASDNIEYLKTLKDSRGLFVYNDDMAKQLEYDCKSDFFSKKFNIVSGGNEGLFVSPLKNLFAHFDNEVILNQTIPTYYTYSDDVSLALYSLNSQKIEYKVGASTSFIEAAVSSITQGNSTSYAANLNLVTPKNSEQIVVIRQYDSKGAVDSEYTVKIIRIEKALVVPKLVYSSIQDDEENSTVYGKKEVCFSLNYTDYVDYFISTVKNQEGQILLNRTKLLNTSEGHIISVSGSKDTMYTLELEAYDKSGRLVKTFKYRALYITKDLDVPLEVFNGTKIASNRYKVNDDSIVLSFPNNSVNNIAGYKIELNNSSSIYTAQSSFGDNLVDITHMSGKKLSNGNYSIRVTPVNILGHESDKTSTVLVDFYNIPEHIKCEVETYENNVANNLNCKVVDFDKDNTDKFIYDVEYTSLSGVKKVKRFETRSSALHFSEDGVQLSADILSNTFVTFKIYVANYNGYFDPKVQAVHKFKYFNEPIVIDSSYYEYLAKTSDSNFFLLIKKHPYISKIECKIDLPNSSYVVVSDGLFVSPIAFPSDGVYSLKVRYTDISGLIFEDERTVYYSATDNTYQKSVNDNIYVDTSYDGSEFTFKSAIDFKSFGHSQLILKNRSLSSNVFLINMDKNVPEVQLSLDGFEAPSGLYVYDIYAFSNKTNTFSKFVKSIFVYYLKERPATPSIVTPYIIEENKKQIYTNAKDFMITWNSPVDIKYLKNIILDIKISNDGSYIPFSETVVLDKTSLFYKIPLKLDSINSQYLISLKTLGVNNRESNSFDLYLNQLLATPKPLVFDLDPSINPKYVKKNINNIYEFIFDDSSNLGSFEKLSKVEVFLNNASSFGVFKIPDGKNVVKNENGSYTLKVPFSGNSALDVFLVGYDKAGNSTLTTEEAARNLSVLDFTTNGKLTKQYSYFSRVVDGLKPVNLNTDTVVIKRNASTLVSAASGNLPAVYKEMYNSIDVMFDLPSNDFCYLAFELYLNKYEDVEQTDGTIKSTEVDGTLYCSGTTFDYQENLKDINIIGIPLNSNVDKFDVLPLDDYSLVSSSFENIKLHFPLLPAGNHGILISSIDLSGNVSDPYLIPITIKNIPSLTPYFVSPLETYVKNDSLAFEWDIDSDIQIDRWDYQFVTGDVAFPTYDESWNSNGLLKSLKKRVYGYDVDSDNIYKLRVRGVTLDTSGKIIESTIPVVKTVVLDLKTPGAIRFTQPEFTNINNVLKYSWTKSIPSDDIVGVYLSFNPSLPLDKWQKVSNSIGEYLSYGQRNDGSYTIYALPYDKAGNVYSGAPISSTITIDTQPPSKIELVNKEVLVVNDIPDISWVRNYNIKKIRWFLLPEEEHNNFLNAYTSFKNLSISDYKYIWDIDYNNEDNLVSQQVLDFVSNFSILKNISEDNLSTTSVRLYYQEGLKHGLGGSNSDGVYYFYIIGEENSGYYSNELNYLKISYDTELIDTDLIELIDFETITSEKKPLFKVSTPTDIQKILVRILNAKTNVEYLSKSVEKFSDNSGDRLFSYTPQISLPFNDYIFEATCFDIAGNSYSFTKLFSVVEASNTSLQDIQDIFISEINCRATITKIRNTSSYVITSININPNCSLFYKESGTGTAYKLYVLGVTQLDIQKQYDFEILGYNILEN